MKKVWRIDVPGRYGYSFAIRSDDETPEDAVETASQHDLYQEESDADYASAEEITDDDYEMKHWGSQVKDIPDTPLKTFKIEVTVPVTLTVQLTAYTREQALEAAREQANQTPLNNYRQDISKRKMEITYEV